MNFRTNKYYLLILLASFIVGGCGDFSGNYDEIESSITTDNTTTSGAVTTLAGTGSSGSANGTGTSASFYYPRAITTDGTNLYVADSSNHLIRKIVISTGAVTTVAGTGSSGSANGTGTSASFYNPFGLLQMEQTYMWQILIIT